MRFGAWVVVKADATGKRFVCACTCGTIKQVGREALERFETWVAVA